MTRTIPVIAERGVSRPPSRTNDAPTVIARSKATRKSSLFLHHQLDCFAPARNDDTRHRNDAPLPVIANEREAIQLVPDTSLPTPQPLANR